jgi:hypothetical protein
MHFAQGSGLRLKVSKQCASKFARSAPQIFALRARLLVWLLLGWLMQAALLAMCRTKYSP